jgi:hypothetical protein
MIVPIVLGVGALGYYLVKKSSAAKAAAYAAPSAAQAMGVPSGYATSPVAPVASMAAVAPAPGYAAGSADAAPTAVYTVAPKDLLLMVARRFTFDMTSFLKANPNFYDGTDRAGKAMYMPGGPGYKNISLVATKYFQAGRTYNLPADSLDNGPREMAMGSITGFVAPGITVDMVPNPPGVSAVQGALIRETMAANQKAGKAASQTATDINYWLTNIKR